MNCNDLTVKVTGQLLEQRRESSPNFPLSAIFRLVNSHNLARYHHHHHHHYHHHSHIFIVIHMQQWASATKNHSHIYNIIIYDKAISHMINDIHIPYNIPYHIPYNIPSHIPYNIPYDISLWLWRYPHCSWLRHPPVMIPHQVKYLKECRDKVPPSALEILDHLLYTLW